jgi:hypothetical protein
MALAFYMDEHVPKPITLGLRVRGVDVLTAQEDEHRETDDAVLLDRATELGRVMFSCSHMGCEFLARAFSEREPEVRWSCGNRRFVVQW